MLNHKTHRPSVPPEHISSVWIAHNAAMREKQKLMSGQHPVIGNIYEEPKRPHMGVWTNPECVRPRRKDVVTGILCIFGAVVMTLAVFTLGAVTGL